MRHPMKRKPSARVVCPNRREHDRGGDVRHLRLRARLLSNRNHVDQRREQRVEREKPHHREPRPKAAHPRERVHRDNEHNGPRDHGAPAEHGHEPRDPDRREPARRRHPEGDNGVHPCDSKAVLARAHVVFLALDRKLGRHPSKPNHALKAHGYELGDERVPGRATRECDSRRELGTG
eukprot:Amastigsp_a174760_125.p3 type:complete len:178 gc:universal Amastigsp_a174760_125:1202-669(-)